MRRGSMVATVGSQPGVLHRRCRVSTYRVHPRLEGTMKRYRIAYRVDGTLHYIYYRYMMQIGGALRGILKATTDWHVEVLGADGKYHHITTDFDGR